MDLVSRSTPGYRSILGSLGSRALARLPLSYRIPRQHQRRRQRRHERLSGGLMKPRLSYAKAAPGAYEAMDALERYLKDCGLDQRLLMLVQLRASQINGCAYCLDMHWKDLLAAAEKQQPLYSPHP